MNRGDICGETVLQILMDKAGVSFEDLCREFGASPESASGGLMEMYYCLTALNEVGFITVDGIGDDEQEIDDFIDHAVRTKSHGEKIRASDKWMKVQSALHASYSHWSYRMPAYEVTVTPFFGQPNDQSVYPEVFVLMPFTDELKPVYTDYIVPVSNELGLSVARADDFFTHKSIISDIWTAICRAKVIVADCTGRNPNVFYEIGIAHTVGKALILITQHSEDVPSDMKHIRYIPYNIPTGMDTFKVTLKNAICWALG
jgi:hypothetical protein